METIKNESTPSFFDSSLKTSEERNAHVTELLANTPSENLSPYFLEKLAEYILNPKTKEERHKTDSVITSNRKKRMDFRETSYEGLIGKLENGEDGIYNMIANDKNIIFQPRADITPEEMETIPYLKELQENIDKVIKMRNSATGSRRRKLTQQIIEMRQDKYVIRSSYKKPIYSMNLVKSLAKIDLAEAVTIDEKGLPQSNGLISLFNEEHISALLSNYSKIKEDSWDRVNEDAKWLIYDLENLIDAALKEKYPMLYDLMIYKIDGRTNAEIQSLLFDKYGKTHTVEYLSSLWKNKIPRLIAEEASREYLIWYYTYKERGHWKKCNRCGQIKLGHNFFFSKNKTAKDGWYSICKECRNSKNKEK